MQFLSNGMIDNPYKSLVIVFDKKKQDFFFCLGFLSQTFMIHMTAGEGEGYFYHFHSFHVKKKLRKPRNLSLPLSVLRNYMCQNISLRVTWTAQKINQKYEKVVLLIREVFYNYYSIESREGIKTLNTSSKMSHDILL